VIVPLAPVLPVWGHFLAPGQQGSTVYHPGRARRLELQRTVEASWLASVVIVIGIVFFGIPFLLRRTNRALTRVSRPGLEEFLHSDLETATGRLPGREAYLQIVMIPLCLALAATALGTIWVWES
jgi:hypothetical protein